MSLAATQGAVPEVPAHKTRDPHAAFVIDNGDGTSSLRAFVRNIVCAACIQRVEKVLSRTPGVADVRVNMTTHRVSLRWNPD